ncbi:MAG: ATP-NAD kinase family protein [Desulfobacterales bacterium]|nr:MAG: ATP-NAD kinase family protein [Desulfobacterales bacterium]
MKKLGFIVNPVAGMGGRVGLKGTDGIEILQKARQLGAKAESPHRALEAIKIAAATKHPLEIITYPRQMGEYECRRAGLAPRVIGDLHDYTTSAQDTRNAAGQLMAEGIDLLLFAGGDGTARDIYQIVGENAATLGIPAGVKIHSGVYAVTPRHAGMVARNFIEGRLMSTRLAEVMDIDEDAFRQGVVSAKLFGYMRVPDDSTYIQSVKAGSIRTAQESLQGIAAEVVDQMDADTCFLIGPGSTTRSVMELLGIKNTLLGVDITQNCSLIAHDVSERDILKIIKGKRTKIVVTIIGGQGLVFGRGNQQISPRVIRKVGKENIIVIATEDKLISLGGKPLLADTGDPELDEYLKGYVKVTTGHGQYIMYKLGY